MPENAKAPTIRFTGFTGAWEPRRLGEIIQDYTEKTTVQNQYPVLTSSQQRGIVFQEDYFAGRQTTTDENIGYFVLPKGYFTYRSRSDNNIFVFNRNDLIDKGIISYFYPVFRLKDADSDFFFRRVNNGIQRQITMAAEGTGQHVLSLKKFKGIVAMFPSVEEQVQIGKVFANLDRRITLHQREHDKTVNIKKAMLEKMFPKNGADKPEIRFAGFTDAWEQRSIEDCFTERNERSNIGSLISVTISSGVMRAADLGRHDTSSHDKSNYKKVEVDDIAYNSMRMWQGASGYSPYSGILSPAYTVITPKGGIHSPFFAHLFKRPDIIHLFQINSQGLTSDTWNLKWPSLRSICINVPQIEEQKKISEFLLKIDRLITLHQHELGKLQTIKKALLGKMFE